MKKTVLILVIVITISFSAFSQSSPHISQYWVPSYYCGLPVDSVYMPLYCIPYQVIGADTIFVLNESFACRIQGDGYTMPLGFFQQFQTDTTLTVIGIAAWIVAKGYAYTQPAPGCTFQIRDSNFNVLVDTVRWDILPDIAGGYGNIGWREFMFAKGVEVTINPGVFRIGYMNDSSRNHEIAVIAKKNANCLSPLPILGVYKSPDTVASIVDMSIAANIYGLGGYADIGIIGCGARIGYSTMMILPIVAEDTVPIVDTLPNTDTIPDSSSLQANILVDKYSQIYPNPAQEEITVACSFALESIELYSSTGERVLTKQGNKVHTLAIDISTLPKGVYLCKIKTAKGFASKKVIIQ